MARVDFYILSQAGQHSRQTFACRLAEKVYKLDQTVHILTRSSDDADRLDELLWTFRDGSFVPHERVTPDTGEPASPVSVGCDGEPVQTRDLLINLCDDVPSIADTFPRVAELVTSDDDSRQMGRRRFAAYRDKGHALETHKV